MEKKVLYKKCMNDGLIFGLILIILNVFTYVFIDFGKMSLLTIMAFAFILFIPLVIGIVIFMVRYKKNELGGVMNYGLGVKYGTILTLFTAIILAAYSLVFNNYIDPDYTKKQQTILINKTYEFMEKSGVPDEMLDEKIEEMEASLEREVRDSKLLGPLKSIVFLTIIGLIISLIVAAIVKKDPQPEF